MPLQGGNELEGEGQPSAAPAANMSGDPAWRKAYELFDIVLELPDTGSRLEFIECQPESAVRAILTDLLWNASADAELLRAESFSRAIRSGARIGRYELGRTLGRGGSGRVYAAVDTELGRTVAVKLLTAGSAANRRAAELLVREAQTASALNHPGIVTIYEVVRHAGEIGLAMELVEGRTLSEFRGAPVPIATVIGWGRQIAQALAAVHSKGIVHRDIKPENVMLCPDGHLKLLDFGLAQAREYPSDPPVLPAPSQGWNVEGTLRYMAPEQVRGEAASPPGDLFSTGILLWELAAGCHPFPGPSPIAAAQAIAKSEPQPFPLDSGVPPSLLDLFQALLSKDPADRPGAAELDQRLASIEQRLASP